MRIRTLTLILAVAAIGIAGCGSTSGSSRSNAAAAPTTIHPAGASIAVKTAKSDLGTVLVGPGGRALYAFTNDTSAKSTCSGKCAEAWPPATVEADWSVGPALDSGIFSTTARADGTEQLTVGKWPLYYFSGDAVAGDTNGQGSGDVWFVVGASGRLIKTAGPAVPTATGGAPAPTGATVAAADSSLGKILVDRAGNTLYGFTSDTHGAPTCSGTCAAAWPAATVTTSATGDSKPVVGGGLDATLFSVVDGPDGGRQLKAGTWPLYRFSGDAAPGDVNGQGSGGTWFVVGADGKLIKAPPANPTAPSAASPTPSSTARPTPPSTARPTPPTTASPTTTPFSNPGY
jgi:predicted lipoprotein with Yx(FWY)xxD motif